MFARIAREYPLSSRAEDAKKRLEEMELPVPDADRAAYDREKFELANYKKPGLMTRTTGWLHGGPDVSHAAKSGTPTMTDPKPTYPASIPLPATQEASNTTATGGAGGTTDVSVTQLNGSSALDQKPDARTSSGTATTQTASTQANQPLPTNRDKELKQYRERQAKKQAKLNKKKKKTKEQQASEQKAGQSQQNQSEATQGAQTPLGTPAPSAPANASSAAPVSATPPPQQ